MFRPIEFLCTLITGQIPSNTINEVFRWNLVETLHTYRWRAPSVWNLILEKATELLDDSSKPLRDRIA